MKSRANLFHYTDGHALMSILRRRELWASHSSGLIDRDEIVHLQETLRSELAKSSRFSRSERRIIQRAIDGEGKEYGQNVFAASFSTAADRFVLWSLFSSEYGAYSIAVDEDSFLRRLLNTDTVVARKVHSAYLDTFEAAELVERTLSDKEDILAGRQAGAGHVAVIGRLIVGRVVYSESDKSALIRRFLQIAEEKFRSEHELDEVIDIIEHIATQFQMRTCFCKKDGFVDEAEFRVAIQLTDDARKRYESIRLKGSTEVPYIRVILRPDEISEIRIGPAHTESPLKGSLESFLKSHGLTHVVVNESQMRLRE